MDSKRSWISRVPILALIHERFESVGKQAEPVRPAGDLPRRCIVADDTPQLLQPRKAQRKSTLSPPGAHGIPRRLTPSGACRGPTPREHSRLSAGDDCNRGAMAGRAVDGWVAVSSASPPFKELPKQHSQEGQKQHCLDRDYGNNSKTLAGKQDQASRDSESGEEYVPKSHLAS